MLHEMDEDILMFWQSRKAVVCGKHQNLCAEVNYAYCRENNIDMARRLSGGGTVYHDPGNVNFTFIKSIPEGLQYAVDYRRFLEPIREALQFLGIETEYSSRNDLLYRGKKISGNAEHVLQKKKRVLHHGTLLFKSDLNSLGRALKPEGVYEDRAVKSVRSEVTNLAVAYPEKTVSDFIKGLLTYFSSQKHTNWYVFNAHDLFEIDSISQKKYAALEWRVGYSPNYTVTKQIFGPDESPFTIKIHCAKNNIVSIQIINSEGKACFTELTAQWTNLQLNEFHSTEFSRACAQHGFHMQQFILF